MQKNLKTELKSSGKKNADAATGIYLLMTKKRRWSIVLGWNDSGFDDRDNETYYVDSGCAISCKIGYEERCNAMQTDMDWDFTMPYDEETGEVDDTCSPVSRNENFEELADYLLKEFKRVTDTWAYWKPEEEEVA